MDHIALCRRPVMLVVRRQPKRAIVAMQYWMSFIMIVVTSCAPRTNLVGLQTGDDVQVVAADATKYELHWIRRRTQSLNEYIEFDRKVVMTKAEFDKLRNHPTRVGDSYVFINEKLQAFDEIPTTTWTILTPN